MAWFGLEIALSSLIALRAAGDPPLAAQLPRIAPVSTERALATFRLRPGFVIELAAAEPLIADPVAMAFDEFGRLFVVEMRDYSERRDERLGRVTRLDDTDVDGRFDRATVFAEGLPWPTAIACYDGGVFVCAAPDLIYLKDGDGDGRAEIQRRVFTGFGAEAARMNVQQLPNSFAWGLDNRIHGALGGNPGTIRAPDNPGHPAVPLRGRDFSFDPRTGSLQAETGGGQHGMGFDDAGRKFVTSNSDHIQMILFDERRAARHPQLPAPPARLSIAADGPAAEVFRASPEEPWRVLRTRWRVDGLVPGPIEGGGRASGYFTGATGVTIYRGDAWPEEYRGNAFIADCGSNLVHRKRLLPQGIGFEARRPGDEQGVEFLASTDNWFRPVQFANAPDGNLYVLDMYREVIEHPWSLPEPIKSQLDLNSGNDRGRLYRIRHANTPLTRRELPGRVRGAELVAMLGHANAWHRETAARLIYEGHSSVTRAQIETFFRTTPQPLGRLHALAALAGMQGLETQILRRALEDADERVRAHALRLLPDLPQALRDSVEDAVAAQTGHPAAWVRHLAALALETAQPAVRQASLLMLLRQPGLDAWTIHAALNALEADAAEFAERLLDPAWRQSPALASTDLIEGLGLLAGLHAPVAAVEALARRAVTHEAIEVGGSLLAALERGRRQRPSDAPQPNLAPVLTQLAQTSVEILQDPAQPVERRIAVVRMLGIVPGGTVTQSLLQVLRSAPPPPLAGPIVTALFTRLGPADWTRLLENWAGLSGPVRTAVIRNALAETRRARALVEAIGEGRVPASALSISQAASLRRHGDAALRAQSRKVLGGDDTEARQAVYDRFILALELRGDPTAGANLFIERCATCHRHGGHGVAVGPDLAPAVAGGPERLLAAILDPNREVTAGFAQHRVDTRDGESYSGVLVSSSDSGVVLRQAGGAEARIARSSIQTESTPRTSLMPEGLEVGLGPRQMADLLAFLAAPEAAAKR